MLTCRKSKNYKKYTSKGLNVNKLLEMKLNLNNLVYANIIEE